MGFPKAKRMPAIKSVMTPFPYSIDAGEPVRKAKEVMAEHGIRHLPVTEAGRLIGVVNDRDIPRVPEPDHDLAPEAELRTRDVCVFGAYVVDLTEPLDRVLLHMADTQIGSALVVKRGKLVGIFTMTDACRCFGEYLQSQLRGGSDDDAA